jgi:hypothetical protein
VGDVEVAGMDEAGIGTNSISLACVALATDPDAGLVLAAARFANSGLDAGITAKAVGRPYEVAYPSAFGPGWISWFALPRLSVTGGVVVGDQRLGLTHATAYHDHNWGRWHWGDDIGWEWGTCHAQEPEITLLVSCLTNRSHSHRTGTVVIADAGSERRVFASQSVRITHEGRVSGPLRRVPGALAALHHDRIAPPLPARTLVHAFDGVDGIDLEFRPRAVAQIIAGDPSSRGYGFIHEMVGAFEADCRIAGTRTHIQGLGVFEYVD